MYPVPPSSPPFIRSLPPQFCVRQHFLIVCPISDDKALHLFTTNFSTSATNSRLFSVLDYRIPITALSTQRSIHFGHPKKQAYPQHASSYLKRQKTSLPLSQLFPNTQNVNLRSKDKAMRQLPDSQIFRAASLST